MIELLSEAKLYVEDYFKRANESNSSVVWRLLRFTGKWGGFITPNVLALIFLDEANLKRWKEWDSKNLFPFPGFVVWENEQVPTAINVSGVNNIFASNRVSNMYSFKADPGSSFAVIDHFQELADPSGKKIQYKIHLALVLGLRETEKWEDLQIRLKSLLDFLMNRLADQI